ncbi:hypothetical protein ACJEC8_00225 [Candidatus Carsonella ruddii]|uniref:hypothetical protein n=1 Tax=Carsonella ruddii TaxID=114186 RepID=UPI003D539ECF
MNKIYKKNKNLKKILSYNYIIISLNLKNIKKSLINLIFNKINFRIIFFKKKELLLLNCENFFCLHFFIIKNQSILIKNILILIKNILNIEPTFLISNTCYIKKIPIEEFSNLSEKNLILKFSQFLKYKFLKLINLLKKYEKHIS